MWELTVDLTPTHQYNEIGTKGKIEDKNQF